ncbi:MAG: DUF262 domain-containing protein [Methylobacterium sp.]|uniref:DUF262 domain-containing protein n=1 Tax=Methylobacterium sp. TaxID=409 RepID=UPI0025DAFFCC|nr:DUF262 domain-containing protein [Methylobacterium sp.]MBX9934704.1 DUF262 domain-containing protein [Methylobacterium sp.]
MQETKDNQIAEDVGQAGAAAEVEGGQEAEAVQNEEASSAGWFTDDGGEDVDSSFKEYDITASPNDFNLTTIVNFIDAGPFKVPGFQRNYVWDIKKASKLIESIMIGLPVPQVFLYEDGKNSFLVIDGQQRLMSIYYFAKKRFPRREKRPEIRRIVAEKGLLPAEVLNDDKYFTNFNLALTGHGGQKSKYHGKNYETLGDDKTTFDLRTIRNVIIKQNSPEEDRDSSVFEIFNRLNTGGVNLKPQEIRASMYHSDLMTLLDKINLNKTWRDLIGQPEPDLHAKDTEVLLRVLAMVVEGEEYTEPLGRFLNNFARKGKRLDQNKLAYVEALFKSFFEEISKINSQAFRVERSGRFSIAIFEAVFRAVCTDAFRSENVEVWKIDEEKLNKLKTDQKFVDATKEGIGRAAHVQERFERARAILAE